MFFLKLALNLYLHVVMQIQNLQFSAKMKNKKIAINLSKLKRQLIFSKVSQ